MCGSLRTISNPHLWWARQLMSPINFVDNTTNICLLVCQSILIFSSDSSNDGIYEEFNLTKVFTIKPKVKMETEVLRLNFQQSIWRILCWAFKPFGNLFMNIWNLSSNKQNFSNPFNNWIVEFHNRYLGWIVLRSSSWNRFTNLPQTWSWHEVKPRSRLCVAS